MIFFKRIHISEQDWFIILFGAIIVFAYFLKFPLQPFRLESLVVVFFFLLTTRSLIKIGEFFTYLVIAILGLIFSTFLSPYGLLLYFIIALILYRKTHLL